MTILNTMNPEWVIVGLIVGVLLSRVIVPLFALLWSIAKERIVHDG